jgi:CubicO group peptidase (beta-lactamase class C family)
LARSWQGKGAFVEGAKEQPMGDGEKTVRRAEVLNAEDAALSGELSAAIPELMRRAHVPGLNVAVARRGRVVWEAGFGYADLQKPAPMTPDTVTRSGSMGKTYTATAVMQLVERGEVALDGVVTGYVGFTVENPMGDRHITVHDLLTHRSGLATNGASCCFDVPVPLAEHLRTDFATSRHDLFRGSLPKWTAPVGKIMQYSNSGIALLGLIVERANAEGMSFSDYVQRHIIDPLGMSSTQFPPVNDDRQLVRPDILERVSTGYAGWGSLNFPTPNIHFADFPAGLVLTTPGDHIRLLLAYLAGGTLDGYELLRPDTVERMLTPEVHFTGRHEQVGLVWMRDGLGTPTEWFGHGGAHMWGWTNDFRAYPKLDLAIAVFTNRWDMGDYLSGATSNGALEAIFGLAATSVAGHAHRPTSGRSWAWKCSYAIGLALAAATNGMFGVMDPFTPDMIDAMVSGAHTALDTQWDPDGFRAALADIEPADFTIAGLDAFVDSDCCQLSRAELDAVWRNAGGRGAYPVPITEAIRALLRAHVAETRAGQSHTPPRGRGLAIAGLTQGLAQLRWRHLHTWLEGLGRRDSQGG